MPYGEGPFRWNLRPMRAGSRARILLWLVFLIVVIVGIAKLADLFPGQASSDSALAYLLGLFVFLAVVSSGLIFARRIKFGEFARNASIWAGAAAVLALGFTYQDELGGVAIRVRSELIPGYGVTDHKPNVLVLTKSQDGHFHVVGKANGTRVQFLIDTGASEVVISPSDARRLGIDVRSLNFTRRYETANGVGWGASFTLATLSVGNIELSDVPVSINQSDMAQSLLGMSFLKSTDSFEIQGRKLFLHWHQ